MGRGPFSLPSRPAVRIAIPARKSQDQDLEVQLVDAVKNDASTGFLQQRHLVTAIRERCAGPAPAKSLSKCLL